MHPLFLKIIAVAVMASVFLGGWATDHYFTTPKPVPQSEADRIVQYCTPIGTGNIPPPINQWVPDTYKNGTYTLYSCKVN